ncbi:Two component system fusion protein (sensory histidine kinase and response regulator) [Aromatoleum bremense]|uniref:histidine kinase n=2 Tax=Aromatoleum bremense TaxID=76115 RepID=A0ABX1NU25_9RHOO|nr:PAS domain-containing protein [Aromatoleum bremense]QTQ31553.1 Two component system fusion protein (sensory histidine kinase and response regulator) [Aromatoleum bremense]
MDMDDRPSAQPGDRTAENRRLRDIMDAIPAHIAYFDDSWTYRYANKAYAIWFGRESNQVVGRRIVDVVPAEVFDAVREPLGRALGGEQVTYEYTMSDVAGRTLHARSTLVPDIGAAGEVLGCYVHAVDITEQRRTQRALAQAQKMEAIGQLSGGLAHDFNNMLTVVMGNLAGLREARPDDAAIEEFVAPAMQAAQGGAQLIERLLAFSRQQPLAPRPVEVNELILGMAKLIRRSLPETIALHTSSRNAELVAMTDAHQLESALLNLALNARDAMPDGGELRIESAVETLEAGAAAELDIPPGDYVQVTVRDTGTGMDATTLAHVFEPFFTTKRFGMGSGLGLPMVYGFACQSGGAVRIRSRQACGTAVALLLPRTVASPAAAGEAGRAAARGTHLAGQLVLLVEDDPEVRTVVRKQLAALGCSVLEAESGQEAADIVENVTAISLVLSDVVMPGGLDGCGLTRFIRRFRPGLPVILMSGYVDRADAITKDLGVPLLAKPFSKERLSAMLDAICR